MSKLNELIAELCPNGVECVKVKDHFQRLKGTPITAAKMKEIENKNGEIRIFAGGKTVINANEEDIPKANITRVPAVLVQSRGVIDVVYYDKSFTFKNEMWAYTSDSKTTVKYLYYVLKNNIQLFRDAASGMGSLPQISLKVTENFKFPLPPLPVQEEIVRILDSFTSLTAELQAELQARQNQYEYYRDQLLTFDVHGVGISEVQWKTLLEVCESIADGDHMPPPKSGFGVPFITISNITNQQKIDFNNTMYVPEDYYDFLPSKRKPQLGDILYTVVGSYGIPVCVENEKKFVFQRHIAILRPDQKLIKPKYLYHTMQTTFFRNQAEKAAKGAAQKTISLSSLGKMKLLLPPLSVQEKIVEVLDNFDAICSDLNIGLPAEIEARQKQYEYYRDALLSFGCSHSVNVERERERELNKLRQYVFGYVMMPLSKVAACFRGEYITKKSKKPGNVPVILGGQEPAYFINESNHVGEIVVVARSGASAGFVSYWNEAIFVTDGFGYEADEELMLPKYLFYTLKNKEKQLNAMKRGAGVPHVSGENLASVLLPVPTLKQQKKIVSILDRFETLCNDMTAGLPAEIEARQKQYEYYRDRLLSFPELTR